MVKISLLLFLFVIQFLLLFMALTVLCYRQYKKQKNNAMVAEAEVQRLTAEITSRVQHNDELSSLKDEISDVQAQFEQAKQLNVKLKASIDTLIPQTERTKEQELVVREIEQCYVELDSFVQTLRSEKEQLLSEAESNESDMSKISLKLKDSVSKEDHDYITAQNNRLELDIKKLKDELAEAKSSYSELEKKYMWLEKEYNALYENVSAGSV